MSTRFEAELFEHVPATPGTVLLRIEGRWHAETREPLPMPLLVVDDGRRSQRLSPLPGPDATPPQAGPEPDLWRASYAAPEQVVGDGRIAFALDGGRGAIVDLPAPSARGRGRLPMRSAGAELAHERELRADAERLADERRRTLRDAEAALDRERAARSAQTVRADIAEDELTHARAELESEREHARADAGQRARDAEAAVGALALAQARVRELDEELTAQRRRTLEAQSTADSAGTDADSERERERERAAMAVAAQRALAEEATRGQVAAQAQAAEHAARAVDLQIARDELRAALEKERERVRALQSDAAAEVAVEKRRQTRELLARANAAERRAADAERQLAAITERDALGVAPGEEALIAELATQRARAEETQRQMRVMAGELVAAGEERSRLQNALTAAHEQTAGPSSTSTPPADPAPTPARQSTVVDADLARLTADLQAERGARARAEEETRLAIDERAELERRLAAATAVAPTAAAAAPEDVSAPEHQAASAEADADADADAPAAAVAVFGPFGDAGPAEPTAHPDEPAGLTERPTVASIGSWDTDEFDHLYELDPPATARAVSSRPAGDLAAARQRRARRGAILLGVVIGGCLLVVLKVAGVLGAASLTPFS